MRILIALLLLAAGSNAFSQTLKIGELNSYKVFPAFLEPYRKGWQLALEEINEGYELMKAGEVARTVITF